MTLPINNPSTTSSSLFGAQASAPTMPTGQPTAVPTAVQVPTMPPDSVSVTSQVPQVPLTQIASNAGLLDSIMTMLSNLMTGIANFFKRMFQPAGVAPQQPGAAAQPPVATTPVTPVTTPPVVATPIVATPAPVAPVVTPTVTAPEIPAAVVPPVVTVPVTPVTEPPTTSTAIPAVPAAPAGLTAEELKMCQDQGITATSENFKAFIAEAQALETQNALGPGSTEKEAITELQTLLAGWGYPVAATGQFDQATTDAVVKFKQDNGIRASYTMADGTPGVHPFVDTATKDAMIKKLEATPPVTPAPGSQYQATPTVTPPATPTAPPVVSVPVNNVPGAEPVATPTPVTPATPQYQAAALSAEEAQIAQEQGILATRENFDAFAAEAQALEAQNAMGPGSTERDAVAELQTLLAGWGYPVTATGAFDQATAEAVIRFKRDNGVAASYKMADGTPGVHPFVDTATKDAMIKKLEATPPVTPAPGSQYQATPTVTPPATPTAPPVVSVPVNNVPVAEPVATPTPVTPATPQYQAAALSAEEAQIAQEQGILATRENFDTFAAEAQALEAQNAMGPGSTERDAVAELQTLLAGWGYPVTATGTFDQATAEAIIRFKRDNGVAAGYKMADGTAGVHPFVDTATKNAMIKKLEATPPVTPAPGSQYQAAPVTPPATADVPPVVSVPVNNVPVAEPVATPTPVTPAAPQYQAAAALSAEEAQVAQEQGVLATRANFDAFMAEAQALEAQNAVGPGSTQRDAVNELQQLLAQWGYAVTATGQFDQATADAVIKFKRDNGVASTYQLADGSPAVHPFVDEATKAVMMKKLGM